MRMTGTQGREPPLEMLRAVGAVTRGRAGLHLYARLTGQLADSHGCLTLLRFREGDANMRSVWLCSRNDVIANLAVLGLSSGSLVMARARAELR